MIDEQVLEIAEDLADLQRGREILDSEGKMIYWDQEHGDEIMGNLTGPLQIPWMYSRKCNFHCRHCYNSSSPDYDARHDADPFLIADRIIEARPYSTCLCGGEPFIWDSFYDVVERLRTGGVPLVSTVTNGFYCTPEAMQRARDAGLTTIQFSIDGNDAEQHQKVRERDGAFDAAVAALRNALDCFWSDLSISMTPTRHNIHDCKSYIEQFADMGVRHIRFQPYMALGRGARNARDLQPSDEDYLRFHVELREMQQRYPEVLVDWGDPLEHIWFYAFTEAHCWTTGITPDGWLETSPYLPVVIGNLKEHSIGEVWAKGMKEVWQSPLLRRFARQVHSTEVLGAQEISMYEEESLHIDVFDDEQWEALMTTDDLAVFRRFSEANLRRCRS